MDFQSIRKEYENKGIDESSLTDQPIDLFRTWYQTAVDNCPGKWMEPNAMALATTDLDGNVSSRFVLMKHIGEDSIQFFTNYDSHKGQQLSANPKCAVAFHWPYLGRQVRIEGVVEKTSRDVSREYFHSRPRGSQIGAAASKQSNVVASREQLDKENKRLETLYEGNEIPLPENWGGYSIQIQKIEFWQGRLDRLHDRIVFSQAGNSWNRTRLSP